MHGAIHYDSSVPNDPVLQFTNATVIREDRAVLHALTLRIGVGEHTAIVGPNGAGKSSFVRLLTHEDRPLVPEDKDAPSPVRVFGSDNWDVFDLRSQLGLVSSDLHHKFVFGNNEGRVRAENAVLSGFFATQGILRYGTVTDDMRRRAAEALDRMGASHLARRWIDEMSSGEARRVLLARALVTKPRALILDEPTTGLDMIARHSFMERVRQIAREGTTLILITHHIEEIIPEIGRVLLLRGGRIVTDGPKGSVLTPEHLGSLFDAPVAIDEEEGYYYARPGGRT
ncbi:MAG: ATP-binding cassette domain-containing protein [Acidobacteria bacterium]|nr:ATP-binding cassette domain-containing protein [Acidobacteriota bacterium]